MTHTRAYVSMSNGLTPFFLLLVIVLICSSEDTKSILQAAENLGLNTGEFVFIVLQQQEVRV